MSKTRAERRAERHAELERQRAIARGDFSHLVIDVDHQVVRLVSATEPPQLTSQYRTYGSQRTYTP